jgi:hypothetical protein
MSATSIALLSLLFIFCSGLLGFLLRLKLTEEHLSKNSMSVISLCTGVLATMGSLVLGLMLSSAKTSFDTVANDINSMSGKIVLLDTALARYGPETQPLRDNLQRGYQTAFEKLSSGNPPSLKTIDPQSKDDPLARLDHGLNTLKPTDSFQQAMQKRAITLTGDLENLRWQLTNLDEKPIPTPFLVALIFWFAAIFVGFGMMTANNWLVALSLLLCATSISAAIFLTNEMSSPFSGLMNVSLQPLENALAIINGGQGSAPAK